MKSKKSLTEYTDRELLKRFAEKFLEFKTLIDDESSWKEEYGEDACFDEKYQKLVGEVLDAQCELQEMCNFVDTLR